MTVPLSAPINTSNEVTLDANGNGECDLGPQGPHVWRITVAAVSIPNAVKSPVCKVFMGRDTNPNNLIDGTFTGQLDATELVARYPLTAGERIFAVWTGGDVGAVATLSIYGDEYTQQ